MASSPVYIGLDSQVSRERPDIDVGQALETCDNGQANTLLNQGDRRPGADAPALPIQCGGGGGPLVMLGYSGQTPGGQTHTMACGL
jgi:hypothetical protein